MSDAPAHHLFVLLGPVDPSSKGLPEILCAVQVKFMRNFMVISRKIFWTEMILKFVQLKRLRRIFLAFCGFAANPKAQNSTWPTQKIHWNFQIALEGRISRQHALDSFNRGKAAAGDLIPWTISQQYQDADFPTLSGARVVRISTHPDYQGMKYGSRALQLLHSYYRGEIISLSEVCIFIFYLLICIKLKCIFVVAAEPQKLGNMWACHIKNKKWCIFIFNVFG